MFQSVEDISVKEGVICDQFKCQNKATRHSRKLGVAKAPPILVIHLKRFKIINK